MIVASGYSKTVTPDTAAQLGFQEYLAKPYGPLGVAEAVRRVLREPLSVDPHE